MTNSIWVIDGDLGAHVLYRELLGIRHRVRFFGSLEDFVANVEAGASGGGPSLVIADLRAGEGRFYEFLRSERGEAFRRTIPFLIVSMVEDPDMIRECFSLGAVDYLTKPFSRSEMIVKVERILASRSRLEASWGPVTLDSASLTARHNGLKSPPLTTREYQVLSLLCENGRGPVERTDIVGRIWSDQQVGSKTLDVHLSNLRKKLAVVGLKIVRDRMGGLRVEPAEPDAAIEAAPGGFPEPPPLF